MAVYSEKLRYIFFANPQTASKAIALTLRQKLDGVAFPGREITRNGKPIARAHHTTYSQILDAGLMTEAQLAGLFKFTCVRNPFDLLVSKYIKHCDRLANDPAKYPWLEGGVAAASAEHSFPQWLIHLSKVYAEIDKMAKGPLEFLAHADLVIRFEALQQGFDEALRRIGIGESIPIIEYNVTKGRAEDGAAAADAAKPKRTKKRYTEYYDPASIEAAEKLFEPILRRFNYRFGD